MDHFAAFRPLAKLDQPSGHVFGMGPTFLVLCIFFILLFVVVALIGRARDRRKGPPPPPVYPILRDKPNKHRK